MYGMSESIELDDATFVVVDTETTGVSADRDRVIEIAAVKVHNEDQPLRPIPLKINVENSR